MLLFWLARRVIDNAPLHARCFAPLLAGIIAALIFILMNGWPRLVNVPVTALVYVLALWSMKAVSAEEIRAVPHVISAALLEDKPEKTP